MKYLIIILEIFWEKVGKNPCQNSGINLQRMSDKIFGIKPERKPHKNYGILLWKKSGKSPWKIYGIDRGKFWNLPWKKKQQRTLFKEFGKKPYKNSKINVETISEDIIERSSGGILRKISRRNTWIQGEFLREFQEEFFEEYREICLEESWADSLEKNLVEFWKESLKNYVTNSENFVKKPWGIAGRIPEGIRGRKKKIVRKILGNPWKNHNSGTTSEEYSWRRLIKNSEKNKFSRAHGRAPGWIVKQSQERLLK